ncbi:YfbM family protein [Schaalia sp. Marseille-Q2122]|uniref:YfbM family protein n=1 Tax=Schaalia sp. Marseille-Q2122 TaxID=2736604 RepID=UPI001588E0F7|nr:YfbM family protein [Schaalia sp. Marseille-Q2122]
MGLRANYCLVTDDEARALVKAAGEGEEAFGELAEQLLEASELGLDIDKMWDILHFILTGVASDEPPEDDALSESIVGVDAFDIDDYAALTEAVRVPDIAAALEALDCEAAMAGFSMRAGAEAELYPDVWDDEDEWDDLQEEIRSCLAAMRAFYTAAVASGQHVLVTIW